MSLAKKTSIKVCISNIVNRMMTGSAEVPEIDVVLISAMYSRLVGFELSKA